jgi:subtilase family serine protease
MQQGLLIVPRQEGSRWRSAEGRGASVVKSRVIVGGLVLGLLSLACTAFEAGASRAAEGQPNQVPIAAGTSQFVCSAAVPQGHAMCLARRRTDSKATQKTPNPRGGAAPTATSSSTLGDAGAYSPAFLESAYDAPSSSNGTGQTVAIVDAYDDPNAASDLSYYRSYFGLSSCTTANGCFRKVNETGGSQLPASNSGWSQEISLDLDMVSAICPNCHILLVEASSSSFSDLGTAVNEAVKLGANVVSNSYGGSEYSGESSTGAEYYNHPGVAITVAAGDSGYGAEFPASANTVTAVGGTTLQQATDTGTRDAAETAWSGTGSGCSAYESKPAWQTDAGCANRTVNDVSAVADPNTGVWVYDSYDASSGSWGVFGGTSVATPIVGSMYALADNTASSSSMNSLPYQDKAALNDVTSGSNGSCSVADLCNGEVGYDGPTGLGTPNGIGAFSISSVVSATAPGSPTGLSASAGNGVVNLSWTAPPSNGGSAITGYDIYRSTSSGSETLLTSVGTGTTYSDSSVTHGTPYYYEVAAVNSIGVGSKSNQSSATPTAPATVPSAPRSLSLKSTGSSPTLTWTAPSSNGGSAITGYAIYRSTASGAEVLIATTGTSTSYEDRTASHGRTYYYEVAAINAVGTGPKSNQAVS